MGYAFTKPTTWEASLGDPIWEMMIEFDRLRYPDVEALVTDLQAQYEHLHEYVERLMESSQAALQNPNIFASQSRMLKKRFP